MSAYKKLTNLAIMKEAEKRGIILTESDDLEPGTTWALDYDDVTQLCMLGHKVHVTKDAWETRKIFGDVPGLGIISITDILDFITSPESR